jgi:hypothetical protein
MEIWDVIDRQRARDRGATEAQAEDFAQREQAMRDDRRRQWAPAVRDAASDPLYDADVVVIVPRRMSAAEAEEIRMNRRF